jgi:predicted ferric reductase
MTVAVRAVFWVIAYVGVVVSPLRSERTTRSTDSGRTSRSCSDSSGWRRWGLEFALAARASLVAGAGERGAGRDDKSDAQAAAGCLVRFAPGQFGWFGFGRSPFSLTQHPFSFSSSAEREEVEVAVKALGDFTSTVGELAPGTTVYVDGPHGVLSIDYDEGSGFGLVAGGVGIAGLISTLRTMADRNDARPVVQFYANGEWEGVAFREELEEPPGYQRFQSFICGPDPMMDAAEAALVELGVPAGRVHTE